MPDGVSVTSDPELVLNYAVATSGFIAFAVIIGEKIEVAPRCSREPSRVSLKVLSHVFRKTEGPDY